MADIHFDNVVLLLAANGIGGFYDASNYDRAITQNGGIVNEVFDGSNDFLSMAYDSALYPGEEDFTLESWFTIDSIGTRRFLCGFSNVGATAVSLFVEIAAANTLRGYADYAPGFVRGVDGSTVITQGVEHHFALVRSGATLRLFLDGVSQGTAAISGAVYDISSPFCIGRAGNYSGLYFKGTVPDLAFRLTKGVARYSETFTPPPHPLPDHATSYLLSLQLSESLAAVDFTARAHKVSNGALVASASVSSAEFTLVFADDSPVFVSVNPEIGNRWQPDTVYALNDKVFPTDPIVTPYYFKRLVAGTSGATEPAWPATPGGQVDDGEITNAWELVERLAQPITHGPLIPSIQS